MTEPNYKQLYEEEYTKNRILRDKIRLIRTLMNDYNKEISMQLTEISKRETLTTKLPSNQTS